MSNNDLDSGDSNNTRFQFSYSGGKYGYKDASGNHVNFRNPTGTATAAQVLSGYTFSNASGDGLTGSYVAPTQRSASNITTSSAVTYYAGYYPNNWTVTPSFPYNAQDQTAINLMRTGTLSYTSDSNGRMLTSNIYIS